MTDNNVSGRAWSADYALIEKSILSLPDPMDQTIDTAKIAAGTGMDVPELQALFQRWAGISPGLFFDFLSRSRALRLLKKPKPFFNGIQGHEKALPPVKKRSRLICRKKNGRQNTSGNRPKSGMEYGFFNSPFGICLIAWLTGGICRLSFAKQDSPEQMVKKLFDAQPKLNSASAAVLGNKIFFNTDTDLPEPVTIIARGTPFQLKVWEALTRIPDAMLVSYQDIAHYIGHPKAVRAVGSAVGKNPVPFLIPCHRVINSSGEIGNYGGGRARKKAMIGHEAAKNLLYCTNAVRI